VKYFAVSRPKMAVVLEKCSRELLPPPGNTGFDVLPLVSILELCHALVKTLILLYWFVTPQTLHSDLLLAKRSALPDQRRQMEIFCTKCALSFIFAPLPTLRAELTRLEDSTLKSSSVVLAIEERVGKFRRMR
jgi:hypothetical protein